MGNRAAALRAAIQAAHPGAVVEARGANWIRHLLPDGKRALDVSSSLLHYDGDQEIDTAVQDSDDGGYDDRADHLPYRLYQRNGDRRIYPRRDVLTEYIELGRPEFRRPNGTYAVIPWDSKTREDNVIAFHRPDARLEVIVGPTRLKMNLVLLSQPTITRWRFPISIVGLTRQGANLIADSDGATVARLAPFTLEDANGVARDVPGTLNGHPTYQGAYVVEPDLSGLTYPVTIDPTVDVAVAANGDDGYWKTGSFVNNANLLTVGNDNVGAASHAFMRFDGITVPVDATIDVAYLTLKASNTNTQATCNLIIYGEDADDPAAAANEADAAGRTLTTASATWSSVASWTASDTIQTPSIVTIIQEIVDRAGWASGNAMQIFVKDNSSSTNARRNIASYDHVTLDPPALHIEYTEAAANIGAALLGPTSTLYGATIAASGAATVSAALLGPTSTLYGATVAAAGDVTISAALLPSGAVLYGASLALVYELSAAFVSSGATLYGATLTAEGDAPLAAAFLPSGATLYGATLTTELAAAFLSSGAVLYGATLAVTGDAPIAAALLGPTSTLYGATIRQLTVYAPFPPSKPRYAFAVYPPLPNAQYQTLGYDLSPEDTTIAWHTVNPGGFGSMNIGTYNPTLPRQGAVPRPTRLRPQARGVLYDGSYLLSEGRLHNGEGPGGMLGGQWVGYGLAALTDGYVISADATEDTAGDILRAVLTTAAPLLRAGGQLEWRDSGIVHTLAEMTKRAPLAVVEQLTREGGLGDLGNVVFDWLVYENRVGRFLPRDAPATPDYIVPFEGEPWMTWNEDYSGMYSTAAVAYTVAGVEAVTAEATTAGFLQQWGFSRSILLTMGETTEAAAEAYRDTWLAMHAHPQYSITIRRTDERGLELPGGSERPAHLVRAGQWVQIAIGLNDDIVLPIVGTDHNGNTGQHTYELGTPNVLSIEENMAEVCRELGATNRFEHPRTGTRTRA